MKGDSVIVVATDGVDVTSSPRVAVEIRDREESEFTLADVHAMVQNREAHAAVVVAAHAGSLPKQYANRSFAISRHKRLITLVLDPDSEESEVVLAAAYHLACALALESVRHSREGDWDVVARKVEAIEQAVDGTAVARTALGQIEKKAHDAGASADKGHALLVRLIAELSAIVRGQ